MILLQKRTARGACQRRDEQQRQREQVTEAEFSVIVLARTKRFPLLKMPAPTPPLLKATAPWRKVSPAKVTLPTGCVLVYNPVAADRSDKGLERLSEKLRRDEISFGGDVNPFANESVVNLDWIRILAVNSVSPNVGNDTFRKPTVSRFEIEISASLSFIFATNS